MLGTIVNALAIAGGSLIGIVLKGGIPNKYKVTIMQAISLAVILIGLKAALKTEELLLVIASLAIGGLIGEFLSIEQRLDQLGQWLQNRLSKNGSDIGQGFVTASLIYCVGSMAIVGSLESGLAGNHQTLYAKSVLDGIASIILASSLGIGVAFSAVSVFVYQGAITLSAAVLKNLLVPAVIGQMSAVGGLLIMGIGINLLEITKIKVGNMLPAMAVPLLFYLLRTLLGD